MSEERTHKTKPSLTWTYNASDRTFVFLSDDLLRPSQQLFGDFISWFEQVCGLGRIHPQIGKTFSVIGAPFSPSPDNKLMLSRGIFLSEDPVVLSGVSTQVELASISYLVEPDRHELASMLRAWDSGAAKNVIHALKAPVNRIRGIASIMRQELGDHPEWDQLIAYLEHSSERLNRLSAHLLEIGDGSPPEAMSLDTLLINAVKTAEAYTRQSITVEKPTHRVTIDGLIALRLERLITNILTSPHPESTGQLRLTTETIDGRTLQINCYDRIRLPQLQEHQQEVLSSEELPEGSVELIRDCEDAVVIRSFEDETSLCQKVIVPIASSLKR